MLTITLQNEKTITVKPKLSLHVFIHYEGRREEYLKSPSHEERFKLISYLMIDQPVEKITYSEYSDISRENLKSIAEELLQNNEEMSGEFQKLPTEDTFFQRVNVSIDTIFNKHKREIAEEIEPVVTPLIKRVNQVFNSLDFSKFRAVGEQLSSISKTIGNIIPPDLIESIKKYGEAIDDKVLRFKVKLLEDGWVNALKLKEEEILELLISLEEEDGSNFSGVVGKFMSEKYTEVEINEIADNWKSKNWLNRRWHIIASAFSAHLREEYLLSVPVLLAQFEGMFRDEVHPNHSTKDMNNYDIREYIKEMHDTHEGIDVKEIVDKYLKEKIHSSFETGKPLDSDLSRHAILHGADVEYGKKTNSLKVIFLFDYVQELLSDKYDFE